MSAHHTAAKQAGLWVPVVFFLVTSVVSWLLIQPTRGDSNVTGLLTWLVSAIALSLPQLAAFAVMVSSSAERLWRSALGYSFVAGILGVVVDISVIVSDSSTAVLGLFAALLAQIFVLVPVTVLVVALVHLARRRRNSVETSSVE